MNKKIIKQKPYSILADIYDHVMSDVDYETWADYIDEIILNHNPEAESLLELACGTGTVALSLEELDCYNIMATDGSEEMIRVAKKKGMVNGSEVLFRQMDFLDFDIQDKFDVVYMIFDSLNYLHHESEILRLHENVKKVLNPEGIFIYDFTTPRNSRKSIRFLNRQEKQIGEQLRYYRESSYDAKEQIHTNSFKIEKNQDSDHHDGFSFCEIHQQKIYTLEQMRTTIDKTDFTILEAYDGFQLKPANQKSLRITMVLQ